MSSKHQNRNFTVEQENIGSILFLSVKICRKNDKFVTSVFRKPIFTGVFTCNKSFISTYQKRGLLHRVYRDFSIYDLIYTFKMSSQSNAVPFCKNYAKLYFDAKRLKQGLKKCLLFKKSALFGQYWTLP